MRKSPISLPLCFLSALIHRTDYTITSISSWAMYGWAPLAIMGEEINKLAPSTSIPSISASSPYNNNTSHHAHRTTEDPAVEMSLMSEHDPLSPSSSSSPSSSPRLSPSSPSFSLHKSPHETLDDNNNDGGMAGIYLGIHNIFATIPQFLATFVSMLVFSILEPGQSPELSDADPATTPTAAAAAAAAGGGGSEGIKGASGLSGTAVCLAIGAVFQLVAAAKSLRMRRYGG